MWVNYDNFKIQLTNLPTHVLQPVENFSRLITNDEYGEEVKIQFDHGTTTLAFQYQGGIILAVDSRATGGDYIGNHTQTQFI